MGDRVLVENGVAKRPDLYISGNYLDLSGVLAGTLNPVVGVLKGAIKIEKIPRVTRLFDCLRVLKLLKAAPETTCSEEI
jgi:putative sterol carrier protein